jgi:1,2-diacylglycerol 3-alpha-glucosyltransferase
VKRARPAPGHGEEKPRVAVVFQRFGPYHLARLTAAFEALDIVGIELSATDRTYAWEATNTRPPSFERHVVSPDIDRETVFGMTRKVWRALSVADPQAVAIAGWSHPGSLAALLWCSQRRIPAIVMSDSAEGDSVRRPWRELIKQHVLSLFSAGLVAAEPHARYLEGLGVPSDAIFDGLDVVDNAHFALGAAAAQANHGALRARYGLPQQYFLVSSRMIAKKNLFAVIEAYKLYRDAAGPDAWHLVMLGDGRLMPALRDAARRAGLDADVHFPGFQQYGDLPAFYGLAGAFILASTTEQWGLVVNEAMAAGLPVIVSERCGCCHALVQQGKNGFSFDPADPKQLAGYMRRVTDDPLLAASMGRSGQATIAQWSPLRFAVNLAAAVARARTHPSDRSFRGVCLLALLLFRRERPDD